MGSDCTPYACDTTALGCINPCKGDGDCVRDAFCDSGTCKPRVAYGAACTTKSECPLGAFCADGVCCNTQCSGQCEACDQASAMGSCIPVVGAPHPGRTACAAATGTDPCATATCDGITRDACTGFVGLAVSCRAPSCADGVETHAGYCNGKGACQEPDTVRCTEYTCGPVACKSSCDSDTDCSTEFRCGPDHTCVSRDAASCDGDHTLVAPDGTKSDCTPYKCMGTACKTTCASVVDCVFPSECAVDGKCAPVQDAPKAGAGGCACRHAPTGPSTNPALGALAALALTLRRRRR
jgi:MYXO-CTERM domain-containing protein